MDIEEIREKLKENGITGYRLAKDISITQVAADAFLSGKSKPYKKTLDLYKSYIENNFKPLESVKEEGTPYKVSKSINQSKTHRVPVYEIDVTSSIVSSFSDVVEIPSFYMDYEPFNNCDAVVTNWGDSMYPSYKNGERLAVKQYHNFDVITWGETFLVITDAEANELKTVKEVYQHEDDDKIILRASNPRFKGDTIINKKNVLALFAVKGKISQNFI